MTTMLERIQKALKDMKCDLSVVQLDPTDLDTATEGVNFGGVNLYRTEQGNITTYSVDHEVYIPGSYWDPPDVDIIEDGEFPNLNQAFGKVMSLLAEDSMTRAFESEADNIDY